MARSKTKEYYGRRWSVVAAVVKVAVVTEDGAAVRAHCRRGNWREAGGGAATEPGSGEGAEDLGVAEQKTMQWCMVIDP